MRRLIILEPPDLGILFGQVFIRIPVTIFERLDSSIVLKSDPSLLEWSLDLVREVHILLRTLIHISLIQVAFTLSVWIFLKLLIFIVFFI